MIISVINHTQGELSNQQISEAIRAINRQIKEDFEPYWSLGATLRLEGRSARQPSQTRPIDMRGDAVIYIWNKSDVDGAIGYHDMNYKGIPFGFVFLDVAEEVGESWTVTLSHEALELIADPDVNLLVAGPHPEDKSRDVFYWYEMCDAVQAESYKIDDVEVSNFVLPLYFTGGDEFQGRNDFLGTTYDDGKTLTSFFVNPGGYIGFFDPETGQMDTYSRKGDEKAAKTLEIKSRLGGAKRAVRYQRLANPKLKQKLAAQEKRSA